MDNFSDYLNTISLKLGVGKDTILKQIILLVKERKKSHEDVFELLKQLSEKLN